MGCKNSKKENSNLTESKKVNLDEKHLTETDILISENDVKLVRESWKSMTDFKKHGTFMMIVYIIIYLIYNFNSEIFFRNSSITLHFFFIRVKLLQ